MGIDRIEPGWIGANLVIEGIPLLSMLPPRTQLFFEGGVTLQDRWRQRVRAGLPGPKLPGIFRIWMRPGWR
jgi:hypothetical protein